jgi:hypothetical protein
MSFGYTLLNQFACQDRCNPCKCPLLNATPYETELTTNLKTTYTIPATLPQWAPVVIDMVTQQITNLTYNLSKGVQLYTGAQLTSPKACSPYFAWPVVDVTIGSYAYVIYQGGGAGPKIIIPYTTMFGVYALGGGAGASEVVSGYALRSDVGYSLLQELPIELSVSYLGVTIFETIITFTYQGYYYSTDAPAYDVRYGNAFYLFRGASISNVPDTPFEVSPDVVDRMGLIYPGLGNQNQPINSNTGNFMFTGFVYDGPIDPKQDIVITAKAVSTAVAFRPPSAIEPQSVAAAYGQLYQPPYIDSQIAGCGLYGTRSTPLPFYDYALF